MKSDDAARDRSSALTIDSVRFWLWLSVVACSLHVSYSIINARRFAFIVATHTDDRPATDADDTSPSCLRARKNGVLRSPDGFSQLNPPAINLGLPKMGSTSLQNFFGCAGYGASHWMCQRASIQVHCAQCISNSFKEGLPPLQKCGHWPDIYAEINGPVEGKLYFPQIELLEEIVRAYPNATFFLTFRSTDRWHHSLTNFWSGLGAKSSKRTMKDEMVAANITGFSNRSGSPRDFRDFFCNHVRRVRKIVPRNNLVEIDIEDPATGRLMADMFDIDEKCWGRANVNSDLHPEIDRSKSEKVPHLIWGKNMIRGKNGTMRERPSHNYRAIRQREIE